MEDESILEAVGDGSRKVSALGLLPSGWIVAAALSK